MWIQLTIGGMAAYLILTLCLTYLVHRIPRAPVTDVPDWGRITDTRIPAADGGWLEVWRVDPEGPSRGIVLLAHGWSRNRDRMVKRARIFGELGFTTVMHSARDHGNSSARRLMNAYRFAEDIESVLDWVREPVLLYGHSMGAAAAMIAAAHRPRRIRALFLEASYARTRAALRSLYRDYNLIFGLFFAPMVVLWMDIFHRFRMDSVSPARLAREMDVPVLIIHGEADSKFPLRYARDLRDAFPAGRAEFYVGPDAGHSDCSLTPRYPEAIRSFVDRHFPPPAS